MRNRYHSSNVNRKNLLPILMRLTSVVLTFLISSITSKTSWIIGWPWSNHVCVSVRLCLSVIDSTNWYMGHKNKYWYFLSGNLDFGLEKSWKNHGTFFWDFCGNPVTWKFSFTQAGALRGRAMFTFIYNCDGIVLAYSDGWPHACVVARPTTAPGAKCGQFLQPDITIDTASVCRDVTGKLVIIYIRF